MNLQEGCPEHSFYLWKHHVSKILYASHIQVANNYSHFLCLQEMPAEMSVSQLLSQGFKNIQNNFQSLNSFSWKKRSSCQKMYYDSSLVYLEARYESIRGSLCGKILKRTWQMRILREDQRTQWGMSCSEKEKGCERWSGSKCRIKMMVWGNWIRSLRKRERDTRNKGRK